MVNEKTCRTCGYVGPVEDFVKKRHQCKKCQSEYNREYSAKWRAENQEKIKADKAQYYAENMEDIKHKAKLWRDENPEQKKINDKRWRDSNLEHKKEIDKQWREEHRSRRNELENSRRKRKKEIPGEYSERDIDRLYAKQNGKCVYCRESISTGYHIDHIIPIVDPRCTHWPSNLQLLCPTCNPSKGIKSHDEYLEYRRIVGLPVFENEEAA